MSEPDEGSLRLYAVERAGDDPQLDVALRAAVRSIAALTGVERVFAARRETSGGSERLLVSVWRPGAEVPAGENEPIVVDRAAGTALPGGRLEIVRLALAVLGQCAEPAVLRVFRGRVRPTELGIYLDEVRDGALSDAANNEGVCGLFLGATGTDRFLTVSAWSGWDAIAAATGGDIRRPMITRNGERIVSSDVTHLEIIAAGSPH